MLILEAEVDKYGERPAIVKQVKVPFCSSQRLNRLKKGGGCGGWLLWNEPKPLLLISEAERVVADTMTR